MWHHQCLKFWWLSKLFFQPIHHTFKSYYYYSFNRIHSYLRQTPASWYFFIFMRHVLLKLMWGKLCPYTVHAVPLSPSVHLMMPRQQNWWDGWASHIYLCMCVCVYASMWLWVHLWAICVLLCSINGFLSAKKRPKPRNNKSQGRRHRNRCRRSGECCSSFYLAFYIYVYIEIGVTKDSRLNCFKSYKRYLWTIDYSLDQAQFFL